MAFKNILGGSTRYPEVRLRWAPTTQPTDSSQTYVDITDRLRGWEWGYGRNDELARFEAGTGSVLLDNRDRALDPSFNAGTWFGNIKPRRMFELVAKWDSVEYPVFVAYARGFPQSYPAAGFDGVVKVDLVDAFAILQAVDLVIGFTRDAELSGARIDAILDAVNIPAGLRDIDAGGVTIDAINVTAAGTSALDHAKTVAAESEFGQIFVARDGSFTFHGRHRRLNASSVHTFSDDGNDLPYGLTFEPEFDETYLWNVVRVELDAESTPGGAEDSASQDDYHPIVKALSSQLALLNDREALANYWLARYKQPTLRAPALPLNGASSPDELWPVILDLEISDRITIERFGGSADPMVLVQNVEGVRHTCPVGGPWLTSVVSSPADLNAYWQLGEVGLSELGTSTVVAP